MIVCLDTANSTTFSHNWVSSAFCCHLQLFLFASVVTAVIDALVIVPIIVAVITAAAVVVVDNKIAAVVIGLLSSDILTQLCQKLSSKDL